MLNQNQNQNQKKDIQVNIRLDKKSYRRVKEFANDRNTSISDAIRFFITHGLFGEEEEKIGETLVLEIPKETKRMILVREGED